MTRYNRKTAQGLSIIDYLEQCGIQPQSVKGHNYWYLSPFREERTASFKVNANINAWMDFGEGAGGNLIDLGVRMHNCSVAEFLDRLNQRNFNFPFDYHIAPKATHYPESPVVITGVKGLSNLALLTYLASRGIDAAIAKAYCKEVDFSIGAKSYFAIGFANRSGGYELRNNWFKGGSSPKDITLIDSGNRVVTVLEGFIDLLSLLQLKGGSSRSDFIILNSVAMAGRAVSVLNKYQKVLMMLNHDKAGIRAGEKFSAAGIKFTDASCFYEGFNDINEFLAARRDPFSRAEIRRTGLDPL